MAIIFNQKNKMFKLITQHTQYMFKIIGDKYLVHCYYGYKSNSLDLSCDVLALGFSPEISNTELQRFSLNDAPLEFAYFGTGDYRCTSLKVKGGNGDSCTMFTYVGYEIFEGKRVGDKTPFARAVRDTETLAVFLRDEVTGCLLTLYYTVYPSYDIITRYFTVENQGTDDVKIQKAMPICLDLPGHEYDAITLHGCQAMECNVQRMPLGYGNYSVGSRRGSTGHNFNPFMAVVSKGTNEENGDVYAFNMIYSGSFLDEIEVDAQGNTRVGVGLGEETFAYTVEKGQSFTTPEAVMLYTQHGLGDMSRKLHSFIRDTIIPREVVEQRPVVINTWEAFYCDINEKLILELADESKSCGMDMVVIDDGWFGERNDDTSSLGDWYPNEIKFPNGLKAIADAIHQKGLKFGIWLEPEMVNPNSELYRKHPDWCLTCKDRTPTLARNQLVLDMTNPEVLEYLKTSIARLLENVDVDYIKWDCNRTPSEAGSRHLPKEQQDEAMYRHQLGVYELFFWLKEKFPKVLLENCSGGGGRYDLGMMAVSTQIWASDNTGAKDRVRIQHGCSLAYPATVMSCHVSAPQYTENKMGNLDYKYKVAIAGMLGYELNILETDDAMKAAFKEQIAFYRQVEELTKYGHLFRLISPYENISEVSAYYYADEEEKANRIFLTYLQNYPYRKRDISWHMELEPQKVFVLKVKAADCTATYKEVLSGREYSGADLIRGIPMRMSEDGEYGKVMLFEKQEGGNR